VEFSPICKLSSKPQIIDIGRLKNVKNFLYRLENKGLIRRVNKKAFSVIDPMFREYVLLKNFSGAQN
jgi:hypothetical protein